MKITIKQAQESDIPVIESILLDTVNRLNESNQPMWSEESVKWTNLSESFKYDDFFIAYTGDEPAGCVAIIDNDPFFFPDVPGGESLFIHKLAVTAKARKSGAADALIDFFKEQGRVRGVKSLQLETHALRPRLRAFYERHGFTFTYIRKFRGDVQSAYYKFEL